MPSAPKSARPRTITYATISRSCPAAFAHHRVRRLAKNAKIHSTPSRDDSVERQVAQVVALVQQPVKSAYSASHCQWRACACWLGRRRANQAQIQSCGSGGAACPLIRPSQLRRAARLSMRRASAGVARMRACSDAMPSRPRRALQRRALWPSRCARRGPCNVARAFRVRETCIHAAGTCSTGKVIAFSTFQDSEIPRHKKKERRYRFKNTGGAGHTILG